MRLRAILVLGLALVLAVLAVFLTRTWIAAQLAARAPTIIAGPTLELTTVVVAASPLRFGTKLDSSLLKELQWPAAAVPGGAFKTAAELLGTQPRVVLQPIEANEPILAGKITGPGGRQPAAGFQPALRPPAKTALLRCPSAAASGPSVNIAAAICELWAEPAPNRDPSSARVPACPKRCPRRTTVSR